VLLVGCGGLQPADVTQGPVPQGQMPENPSRVSGVRQSPRSVRHASVTETTLYSFKGFSARDGAHPESGLTYFNGTFYGTTTEGGSSDNGTVYSITPSGTETVLHSFKGGKDGAFPLARLIKRNGTLYGTTSSYRALECPQPGCGTVFSVTPSGHETVLHGFAGPPDGSQPEARLLNVNGTLYGTTDSGGSGTCGKVGCGTVFSITPGGKEKVLYSFRNGTDGAFPAAGLIDVKGTLYGTTQYGGAYSTYYCGIYGSRGCGTVFTITPSGKEKVLHSFGNGKDGTNPSTALIEVKGTLYGTTFDGGSGACGRTGCGTVFSITRSGREKVLYNFSGPPDAANPEATLLNVNGTLYGTTQGGGPYECGTIFSITLSGYETVLYSFPSSGHGKDGCFPDSGLIDVNGTLYGTNSSGGAYLGGTVFSITP
jgi:uncharacterized repeat protein (TIGR03803 family)